MTTTTEPQSPTADLPASLAGRKLSSWSLPVLALVVAGVVWLLAEITPLQGYAGCIVTFVLLYVASQTILSFSIEGLRQAKDRLATTFVYVAFGLAILPLLLITIYTLQRGLATMDLDFLYRSMFTINPDQAGGGAYHAILGTLLISLIATAIAVPLGILTAVYLVEYGGKSAFGRAVSFFVDVMTGVPSIVAGLFIYAFWLQVLGFQKSGFAGSLSLVILMLPIVVRSTEEMLKLVPMDLREASYALGVPKWRTVLKVVIPTALGGIITGVMLGVARIMGETAPLLLLVGVSSRINGDPFDGFMSTLPTFIYQYFNLAAGNPNVPNSDRAWAAALTLILVIMLLNVVARVIARFSRVRG